MCVASHPHHGLGVVAAVLGPKGIVAHYSVLLEEIHYSNFAFSTDCNPFLKFVLHRGPNMSLRNFIPTMATIIQKPQEVSKSTIGQLVSQPLGNLPCSDCDGGPKDYAPDKDSGVFDGSHCLAIIKNPILAIE